MNRGLALSLLLLPASAWAAKVEVPRAELCELSTLVVIGEVTGHDTTWAQGSEGMILTVSDVAVQRTLRGDPVQDLRVTTRGGSLQGLTQQVEDAAVLHTDRRYLLMLTPRKGGGWRVVGGDDGAVLLPWDDEVQPILDTLGGCLAH